jgi:exopolysaccharide biosynthesis polyprenyl glycosylphosphotransferase
LIISKKLIRFGYLLTDFLAAAAAWLCYYLYRSHIAEDHQPGKFFSLFYSTITIAVFWCLVYGFWGFYRDYLRKSRMRELFNLFSAVLMGVVLIFLILILDEDGSGVRIRYYKTTTIYFLIHLLIAGFAKMLYLSLIKRLILSGKIRFETLLLGNGPAAMEICLDLRQNSRHLGLHFTGFMYLDDAASADMIAETGLANLGHYSRLAGILESHNIEQVVVAIEATDHPHLEEILTVAEGKNRIISILPDMYQILLGLVKVQHVFGTPLIEIRKDLMPVWQQVTKRAIDILASLLVLVLGSPFFLLVALITKVTSRGPILFFQERIGKDAVPFNIIKFRSMYVNAEKAGPALSSQYDPRITPWGRFMRKTRIDEFPQFYNVLIGEMSLVGPRPERQFFIDKIMEKAPHYRHLTRVKPGITSLGQVKYGYAENVDQMVKRLKFDILYIENMSLGMDFRILIHTVLTVLGAKGK